MDCIGNVLHEMIGYYKGDVRRINHFLKVYGFAKAIGAGEGLCEKEQEILEIAALTHDIGIKNSEQKFGSSAGTISRRRDRRKPKNFWRNWRLRRRLSSASAGLSHIITHTTGLREPIIRSL